MNGQHMRYLEQVGAYLASGRRRAASDSSRTSTASRSSRQVRGRISTPIRMRGDRVGPGPAGDRDDDGGDQYRDRAERVVDDLEERRPGVEVVAPDPGQQHDARPRCRPDRPGRTRPSPSRRPRRVRTAAARPRPGRRRRRRAALRPARRRPAPPPGGSPTFAGSSPGGQPERRRSAPVTSPAVSVSMCPASASNASDPGHRRADDLDHQHRCGDRQHDRQRPPVPGDGRAVRVAVAAPLTPEPLPRLAGRRSSGTGPRRCPCRPGAARPPSSSASSRRRVSRYSDWRPTGRKSTRPQSRRHATCPDTVDCARPSALVRSTTRRSPRASSCTIASRVGSARLRNNATAGDRSALHAGS